jgi:alanyl-tRNA synthetase
MSKKKYKQLIVGTGTDAHTKDTKNVLSGKIIFHLMDSQGLPFDIIMDILKEKSLSYNVYEFIEAAINSKNFTKERLRLLFEYNQPNKDNYPDFMKKIDDLLTDF